MNTLSLKDIYLKKAYSTFDPRMKMIISKNDGLFDNCFNLIKDQLICFHQFNKIGNDGIEILRPPTGEIVYRNDIKEEELNKPKIKKVKIKRV